MSKSLPCTRWVVLIVEESSQRKALDRPVILEIMAELAYGPEI